MLAISQSGENYYYLNWVPSEAGPMVTQHGSIKKELKNPDKIARLYLTHNPTRGFMTVNEILRPFYSGNCLSAG